MMHRGISALGALARLSLAAAAWGAAATIAPAAAQPVPPAARSRQVPDAETFLRLAHSAAVLQAQAAELAASRDTRPEVRAFARRMVEFRREQIASLLSAARERTLAVSPVPALEHKVILENLEPLELAGAQPALLGGPGPSPGAGDGGVRARRELAGRMGRHRRAGQQGSIAGPTRRSSSGPARNSLM